MSRLTALGTLGMLAAAYYAYKKKKLQKRGNFAGLDGEGDAELTRVAFTSRWVAAERHLEHTRDDALFSDPLAGYLGGDSGAAFSHKIKQKLPWENYHVTWMAIRTKYIDDRVAGYFAQTPNAQYVNLGSGLDARVYRLGVLAKARAAFEIDVPEVVAAFNRAMTAHDSASALCPRASPSVDLTVPGALLRALRAAGFDPAVPTFWLLEGLTMYMSHDVNDKLLQQIDRLSGRGSQLCAGFIADVSIFPDEFMPAFSPTRDEYCAMLRKHGWSGDVVAARYGDASLNFGRYPSDREPDESQCFVLAER